MYDTLCEAWPSIGSVNLVALAFEASSDALDVDATGVFPHATVPAFGWFHCRVLESEVSGYECIVVTIYVTA